MPGRGVGARGSTRAAFRRVRPRAAIQAAWHQHRDLLSNAGSLVMSTGVASLLGVVYWAVATRLFSQGAVGYASAAVSAMISSTIRRSCRRSSASTACERG